MPARPRPPRLPAFHPVPVRARADGWTAVRQCEFIGMLAQTGSVSAAAAFVGCSRETAYRLRRKAGAQEFARAWDVALVIAGVVPAHALARQAQDEREGGVTRGSRKVTPPSSWRAAIEGLWRPVMRRGRYCASVHKPDNSALLSHLAQLDRGLRADRKALRRQARSQLQNTPFASGADAAVDGAAGGSSRAMPGPAGGSSPGKARDSNAGGRANPIQKDIL
jgi:hypothetical protein